MRSYYRPDYDTHQEGFRRTCRRRRFARLAVGVAGLLALGSLAAVVAAGWSALGPGWFSARLASAGLFRLERIEVRGLGSLATADVLSAAGLRAGESILGLDLPAARGRLSAHPWVREARLRRRLPATLLIEIEERVPLVVVRAEQDYLVDAEGAVVAAVPPGGRPGLPVLTGLEVAAGSVAADSAGRLAAGLELIAAIRAVGFPALEAIGHIDLADADDAVIVPVAGRPIVHAGRGEAALRLGRWKLVAPEMATRWAELEYVDLRADGQVVVLPTAPPPAPGGRAPAAGPDRRGPGGRDA